MLTATSLSEVLNGQFSSHLSFLNMSSHIDLCAVDEVHGKIEKTMRDNTGAHEFILPVGSVHMIT